MGRVGGKQVAQLQAVSTQFFFSIKVSILSREVEEEGRRKRERDALEATRFSALVLHSSLRYGRPVRRSSSRHISSCVARMFNGYVHLCSEMIMCKL